MCSQFQFTTGSEVGHIYFSTLSSLQLKRLSYPHVRLILVEYGRRFRSVTQSLGGSCLEKALH